MSYDNAEPKVLKTLNSSGQVLDDGGNVINDTTSYWEKKYNEAEPKPDKILKSDGSVVDSNGNQIQATNEYNVKKYNQAEPIPAKYLHADGTVDENPGSGGGQSLYIWSYEQGSGSVILPVGTFDEVEENMKGVGCSASSEYMSEGIVTSKTEESFVFTFGSGSYLVTIPNTDTAIEFPSLI